MESTQEGHGPSEPGDLIALLRGLPSPIAVVGNGQLGANHGALIDAHPVVIRFNGFKLAGFEQLCGTKTTFWARNGLPHPLDLPEYRGLSALLETSKRLILRESVNHVGDPPLSLDVPMLIPYTYTPYIEHLGRRYSGRPWYCATRSSLESMLACRAAPRPTAGFLILFLLSLVGKKVSAFGFDGLRTGHYWDPDYGRLKVRSPEDIKQELRALLGLPGVRVYSSEPGGPGEDATGRTPAEVLARTLAHPGTPQLPSQVPLSSEELLRQAPDPVALVGNGHLGSSFGKQIDAFPTVIRFNNFRLKGFEDLCGTKTTHWCTTGFVGPDAVNPLGTLGKVFSWLSAHVNGLPHDIEPVSEVPGVTESLPAFSPFPYEQNPVIRDPLADRFSFVHDSLTFTRLPDGLGGLRDMNVGFAAAILLSRLGKRVSAFGFDGFKSGHYWNPRHRHATRFQFLAQEDLAAMARLPGITLL
jgi:hypothetical protein